MPKKSLKVNDAYLAFLYLFSELCIGGKKMDFQSSKPEGSYISFFSNLVKEKGGINLAQGIPGFDPPSELIDRLGSMLKSNIHQYAPGTGNYKLLEAIYLNYANLFPVKKENFLIVQGATEALSLIFAYLNQKISKSFTTLSFEPAYESYSNLPVIFGREYLDYHLDNNYSFDYEELKETIVRRNVKVVFISSPGNPFGKIWSQREISELLELANELDFYLIFDAVYKDLYFSSPPYIPLELDSPRLFYVNSFSKSLCITGWRVGYLYTHESHRKGIRAIHDYTGLCAPSLLQEALAEYLSDSNYGQSFVSRFRFLVHQNFITLYESLKEFGFIIPPIDGGCFIWTKLPVDYPDGFSFALDLFKTNGVAVIPGEHFSKNYKSWVRINIARPLSEINRGIELISEYLSKS